MANIEEKVENTITGKIEELGYELYDVEYAKEGKDYFLRIYIDKQNGINIEDCEKVSNGISDILDESDLIKEQYFLEVSSPGVERVLKKDKHLESNIGQKINIKLFQKDEHGIKNYIGELKGFDEKYIIIYVEEKEEKIDRKNIANIKTIYDWEK